jgi:hypothetical protein
MGRGSNIAMNSFEGGMVSDLHGSSPKWLLTLLTWSLSPWVKTSIFQNIKAEACIRSSEFYDRQEASVHSLRIKINNNIAYILVGCFRGDGTLLQEV